MYNPTKLTPAQKNEIDKVGPMKYEIAKEIFHNQIYNNPPMRGRQSFSPLKKMGLCFLDEKKIVRITDLGTQLANNEITLEDFIYNVLLKYQLPQYEKDVSYDEKKGFAIKPLIGMLHLIKKVNELWEKAGNKPVGISKEEFDYFIPTLINYKKIEEHANNLIKFRIQHRATSNPALSRKLVNETIIKLAELTKEKIMTDKNLIDRTRRTLEDYGDNVRRYFRITGWISYRGNGRYIDLEQRRSVEIESLLDFDDGSPREISDENEYIKHLADPTKPELPWKSKDKLVEKYQSLLNEVKKLTEESSVKLPTSLLSPDQLKKLTESQIDEENKKLKIELKRLDELKQIDEMSHNENLCEVIDSLKNLKKSVRKTPLELEFQTARGLMALNDGKIHPNYPLGDDGEPLNTAPGGVADIYCFYEKFNMICEVTMLTTRSQWMMEGTPVPRHLRSFEKEYDKLESFSIFIAPAIHEDTITLFWNYNKYGYQGKVQRIIPIKITQFIEILETLREFKKKNHR